jgi:hypothetical protein
MIDIELLAKEIYERFALEEYGQVVKWEYLGKPRQVAWVKDVTLIADKVLKEVRKSVKPPSILKQKMETAYSLGFKDGQKDEKILIITMLQQIHEDLIKDYAEFLAEE